MIGASSHRTQSAQNWSPGTGLKAPPYGQQGGSPQSGKRRPPRQRLLSAAAASPLIGVLAATFASTLQLFPCLPRFLCNGSLVAKLSGHILGQTRLDSFTLAVSPAHDDISSTVIRRSRRNSVSLPNQLPPANQQLATLQVSNVDLIDCHKGFQNPGDDFHFVH